MKRTLLMLLVLLSVTAARAQNCACTLGYPDNSNLPKSAVVFNENEVLVAIEPGVGNCVISPTWIKVWYNDEHALTLGVRQVVIKTSSSTTTTNYPISIYPGSPTSITNPLFGTTIPSGSQCGNDVSNRPMWPSLFITDITTNLSSRIGDWQQGGTGRKPDVICGSWKGAVRNIDSTKNPVQVDITPDADPAKNNWNLAGCDAPPSGSNNQGFGSLVKWNVASLGLIPGHTYRIQVMVHDGDQNKTGGDCGQKCTTISIPVTLSIRSLVVLDAKNINGNSVITFKGESTTDNEKVVLNFTMADGSVKHIPILFWTKLNPQDTWEVTINNITNQVLTIKKK